MTSSIATKHVLLMLRNHVIMGVYIFRSQMPRPRGRQTRELIADAVKTLRDETILEILRDQHQLGESQQPSWGSQHLPTHG